MKSHGKMRTLARATSLLPCLLAGIALAADAAAEELLDTKDELLDTEIPADVFRLGSIVITATPDGDPFASTVSYTTKEEMQLFDTDRVSDSLNLLPGVSLNPGNRGGARNETGVFVRGFDQSRVPVLLDGMPIYVPYDGYLDLNRVLTADLSTVEVVKGYTSVLYGPNALGGVINLTTSKPSSPREAALSFGVELDRDGNYEGNRLDASGGVVAGDWYVQGGMSRLSQQFWTLPADYDGGLYQDEGYRDQSASSDIVGRGKIGYTPEPGDEYVLGFSIQRGSKEAPPYAGDDASSGVFFDWPFYDKNNIYATTLTTFDSGSYIKTRLYWDNFNNSLNRYDNDNYNTQNRPYAFSSEYDDNTYGGSIEGGIPLTDGNLLAAAAHLKYDQHQEFGPDTPTSTMEDLTMSLGIEDRQSIGERWQVIAGLGYDKRFALSAQDPATQGVKSFDTQDQQGVNAEIGVNFDLTDNQRIYSSIVHKIRFPTMYERYSYRLGFSLPNPDLAPEQTTNYEIGYEGFFWNKVQFNAAAFFSDVENYIQYVTVGQQSYPPYSSITQAQNIGTVQIYGIEMGAYGNLLEDLQFGLNYTFLKRKAIGDTTAPVYGTPDNKLFAYLQWDVGAGVSIVPSVEYQSGKDTSDVDDGLPVSGYTLANLKVTYQIFENTRLEAAAYNIFDTYYEFDDGYPGQGRNFLVTIRQEF